MEHHQPTKRLIKDAFIELYAKKPIRQISVNDIIRSCKCSRSTFYFYYEDIYALYKDCEQDAIKIIEDGLPDVVLYSVGHNSERYADVFSEMLYRMKDHSEFLCILLEGSQSQSFKNVWFESIRRHFLKTLELSKKKFNETEKQLIAEFFAAGKLRLLTNWFEKGCMESPEELSLVSAHAQFYGLV